MDRSSSNTIELSIKEQIYAIRGMQVLLDRDLAEMYGVSTKVLNQSVKRNIQRFPKSFCFQLSPKEYEIWRSQIVTSKSDRLGLRRPPVLGASLKDLGKKWFAFSRLKVDVEKILERI